MHIRPTIFFHVGGAKAGSSALQAFFVRNRDVLRRRGVAYELADDPLPETEISSGNGVFLRGLFGTGDVSDRALDAMLARYRSDAPIALCSSELFRELEREDWRRVRSACERLGLVPRFVMFARDVVPFYRAAHHQYVKRHGESRDLADFVREFTYHHAHTVRDLVAVFGRESLDVHHYESERGRMGATFLSVMGIDAEGFDYTPLARTINRSLTERELSALRQVNAVVGDQFSQEISDWLLSQRPDERDEAAVDPSIVETLRSRHAEDVAWVNREFFGGRAVLDIGGDRKARRNGPTVSDGTERASYSPEREVMLWLARKISSCRESAFEYVVNKVGELAKVRPADLANLPTEFDPVSYLLINRDVLQAGCNPYEHYARYGSAEGRRWRWDEPQTRSS